MRGVLYSAPSRLIGHRLKVRLYHDRLDCYLGASLVLTVPRGHPPPGKSRGRVIDYRHLHRGAQAQAAGAQGPDLPRRALPGRRLPPHLGGARGAPAAAQGLPADGRPARARGRAACEAELGARLEALLDAGELPDLDGLRDPVPAAAGRRRLTVEVPLPAIAAYDALLARGGRRR